MTIVKYTSKWDDSISFGCLSQCFRNFVSHDGKKMVLYCRWRQADPWSYNIYEEMEGEKDGPNILLGYKLSEYDSIEKIHLMAERLLLEYLEN